MKTYLLKTSSEVPPVLPRFPALRKRLAAASAAAPAALSLGADLERGGACVAAQIGPGAPLALGLLTRAEGTALVRELTAAGHRVAAGVEACGFGWTWQGELRAAGAEVVTLAPEPLCGRRKTNRRDAAALAKVTAARLLHNDAQSGRAVREPAPREQQRRALSRHRAQLIAVRGKLEAQGRGLLLDFGRTDFPDCWWGKKMWPRLHALLREAGESFLLEILTPLRALAQSLHARVLALDEELEILAAEVPAIPLPAGLGELTGLVLSLEVMDWSRFQNRKQAGSYIGCCPVEYSTGEGQRLGGIDRMGNRRLRSALTEAVWRLRRWEPGWRGFVKWGAIIGDKNTGSVRKKKAVIACVRLLFIDLWRLHTGRATLAGLGFKGRPDDKQPGPEREGETGA